MKRLVLVVLFLFGVGFFGFPNFVQAQTGQNVVLSCLDATLYNNGNTYPAHGKVYGHSVSLRNREVGIFSPSQPVYIIRSLPKVFCNPGDGNPACAVEPGSQFCIQEKIGAALCNQDCPSVNLTCSPNNQSPGRTVCCMPNYQQQGPYFECAKDYRDEIVCPGAILSTPEQSNGIHVAEDGHIETGWESSFVTTTVDKAGLLADPDGNVFIEAAESYTRAALDHGFYGMQILSDEAMNDNEAFRNTLKLAVFAEIDSVEPSATNCTTVFWDPFGKIIDSLRLEPIPGTSILLSNLTSGGQTIKTSVADNPTFRNPDLTSSAGDFNFAVPPGTYYLSPSNPNFTFPTDSVALGGALSILASIDPNQEYFVRDKNYNDANEPIVEKAGASERRDIILTPKDPNYTGSAPVVLYAENLRDNDNQTIRGRVSHPKSIIKIYVGGVLVGQVEASLQGAFTVTIPSEIIGTNNGAMQIVAEKVPLTQVSGQKNSPLFFLTNFIKTALAQEGRSSRPYSLSMVPVRLTGFVFDPKLKTKPNATVKLKIPSLGNLTYSQTKADNDGFIDVKAVNLPPFDFVVEVSDSENLSKPYQLTIDDFKKTNGVYYEESGSNLYNKTLEANKPDPTTIAKIGRETPKRISPQTLSYNQPSITPIPSQNSTNLEPTSNPNLTTLMAILGAVVTGGVIIATIVVRSRSRKTTYY